VADYSYDAHAASLAASLVASPAASLADCSDHPPAVCGAARGAPAMTTLFISDLHLDAQRPDITRQFLSFLANEARRAQALYILGDLFEAWIGDDDPESDKRQVVAALRELSDAGVPVALIHGNRDFLIGRRFCRETGVTLLPDGTIVNLYGRPVLLMHGDTLCTDDRAYQRLRRVVRNPLVQFVLRHLSLKQRLRLAQRMREGSKAHIASMDQAAPQIMDVNQDEVRRTFQRYGVDCIVHGHTHRPAIHDVVLSPDHRHPQLAVQDPNRRPDPRPDQWPDRRPDQRPGQQSGRRQDQPTDQSADRPPAQGDQEQEQDRDGARCPAGQQNRHPGHGTRIVLGDWYEQGSVLRWNERGYELASLPLEHRAEGSPPPA